MTEGNRRFGSRAHLTVNALCIGFQFQDAALFSLILPVIILKHSPDSHVATFAMLTTISTALGTLTPTAAGWLSDQAKRAGFSRRLQATTIVALDVLALAEIATTHSLLALTIAVAVASVAAAGGETVYQAILPEVVPRREWGISTGVRGALTLLGAIIGLITAGYVSSQNAVWINAGLLAATAATMIGIPPDVDPTHDETQRPVVRDRRDLVVTMMLRGFIVLGIGLFTGYALYFFHDVLRVPDAPLRTGLTALAGLVGAMASSIVSGIVSDRVDRRYVVAGGGVLMALGVLGFALNPDPNALFLYAGVIGIGLGAVFAAGLALTLGAVPNASDFGRDLGAWSTISGLPAIFAPALGAFVLTRFHHAAGGYRALFILASVSFTLAAASALLVRRHVAAPTPVGRLARQRAS